MLDRRFLAPHAVAQWAQASPSAIAAQHVDGRSLTYAALHDSALRWAAAFARLGIERGTHVATMLPIGFESQLAMLGLGWIGAIDVPINAAYRGQLLHFVLDHADVTMLVIAEEYLARFVEIAGSLPEVRTVIVVNHGVDGGVDGDEPSIGARRVVGHREFLDGVSPATDLAGPEYRDIAALLFTSGTTGPSKAVIVPWALVYQFWSFVPDDALSPGDGLFLPFPLFHNSGRSGFNYAMTRGARLVFRERFSAATFWDDVRATDTTVAGLVGPLTSLLYSAPPREDDADNPLRAVVVGPMIPEMVDFERRFGVRACTSYGQTEVGCPVATGWDHGPWSTCGRPRLDYPWHEVRIVDDNDEPVETGVVGEMAVRCAEPWALNVGYYKSPEQTVEAWRNGWFHTGDAMRCDDDGWYYFVDRLRDSIRRRGENISSFEIENLVGEYPDIVECAAIGMRTPHGDDDVMIALIVHDRDAFDPAALMRFLEPRLPKFMLPRYVEVFDDFPRNETSMRVRKNELRARGVTEHAWDREAVTGESR
ncbi:MAG TPA: AMP-binding protein [Acidimicrobiales bacterium]|nr:AMP-binding protein [Acidimicrobiales bacterium]